MEFNNFILEENKNIFGNVFIPSKSHWKIGLMRQFFKNMSQCVWDRRMSYLRVEKHDKEMRTKKMWKKRPWSTQRFKIAKHNHVLYGLYCKTWSFILLSICTRFFHFRAKCGWYSMLMLVWKSTRPFLKNWRTIKKLNSVRNMLYDFWLNSIFTFSRSVSNSEL